MGGAPTVCFDRLLRVLISAIVFNPTLQLHTSLNYSNNKIDLSVSLRVSLSLSLSMYGQVCA